MDRNDKMETIANSCPGYNAVSSGFQSNIGPLHNECCQNCAHFEGEVCNIDLYDKV